MRARSRRIPWATLLVMVLVLAPQPARAVEVSAGVSLGGIQAGAVPRLAVSPHMDLVWNKEGGFLLAAHELLSILPSTGKDGIGINNQMAAALGYSWENGNVSLGPSLAIFSMPACGATLCGRVTGLSAGGYGQANVYITGPWGLSVSANVGWVGGKSFILPGGVTAMVVAGPVVRWSLKGL